MFALDGGSTTRSSQPPSPADWERHKAVIRYFYIDDNMTLQELMGVMQTRYQFLATTRSYKRRLQAWNMRKNVRLPPAAVEQAQAILTTLGWESDQPGHLCFTGPGSGDSASSSSSYSDPGPQDLVSLPGGQTVRADRLASHLRRKRKPQQQPRSSAAAAAAEAGSNLLTVQLRQQYRVQQQQQQQQQQQDFSQYHHHHHYYHHGHRPITPRPRAPIGGHPLRETEAVLAHTRAYILGRFADRSMTPDACDERALADWVLAEGRWAGFHAELMRALGGGQKADSGRSRSRSSSRRRGGEGRDEGGGRGGEEGISLLLQCLRRTPWELTTVVRAQPANLITHVFVFLQGLCQHAAAGATPPAEGRQLLSVVRSLARYMAGYTAGPRPQGMGLPSGHPLPRLFQSLSRVEDGQLLSAATQSCRLSCTTWDSILGPKGGSCSTTGSWIVLGSMSSSAELPADFLARLDATTRRYERDHGPSDFRCHTMLAQRVAYLTLAARGRGRDPDLDDDVLATALDLLSRGPLGVETRLAALQTAARCCLARGRLREASRHFGALAALLAARHADADADADAGAGGGGGSSSNSSSPSSVDVLEEAVAGGVEGMARWLDRFQASALVKGEGAAPQLEPHVYLEGIMRGGSPALVVGTAGSDTSAGGLAKPQLGIPEDRN